MHSPIFFAHISRTRSFWSSLFPISIAATVAVLPATGCLLVDTNDDGRTYEYETAPIALMDVDHTQALVSCAERVDVGYVSGDPFDITVVTADGKPAERETANAYAIMQAAAADDGIRLRVVSGFRTMDEQEYLYQCYVECSCNNCNLAARPGYSNHQSGHALDLNTSDDGVYDWLENNGSLFGFERTVPSEDWHWEWWGGGPGGGPCATASDIPEACESGNYTGEFCDDEGSAFAASHDCVATAGIAFGCGDVAGSPAFCGAEEISRAEAATMLMRLAGVDPLAANPPYPDGFADDNGHDLELYLNAAKAHGVILGDGTNVKPDGAATRTALAVMLTRLYALPESDTDYFADDDGTDAETWHNRIRAAGLTSGCGTAADGRALFCGDRAASRSETAAVVCAAKSSNLVVAWEQNAVDPNNPNDPNDAGVNQPVDPNDPNNTGSDLPDEPNTPDEEIPPEHEQVLLPSSVVDACSNSGTSFNSMWGLTTLVVFFAAAKRRLFISSRASRVSHAFRRGQYPH